MHGQTWVIDWPKSCFGDSQEVPMFDTKSTRSVAQQSTTTNREASAEQVVIDQIMQPFMGNQDWANLVAPSENSAAAVESAIGPDDSWLPGGYETTAFLSGLTAA
jgi:hypothetical protein